MRKKILLFLVLALVSAPALALQGWRSVAVQKGAVRVSPMPFAKIIATLGYGERVDILAEQGLWFKIREQKQGREGWMHSGSLIAKKITLQSGERLKGGASEDELALGGKGFNSQVEAEYKARQKNLDYASVDWMEKIQVTPAAMREFLAKGGLQNPEGGAGDGK